MPAGQWGRAGDLELGHGRDGEMKLHDFIAEGESAIRVMRPLLPDAARLAPYLQRIDTARIYSNYGPLVAEFEQRLATTFGLPGLMIHSAASGTAALVGAVLAAAGRARTGRRLALMPAYTFVATAAAAELCGYEIYLADIDPETWMLNPLALLHHPMIGQFGVVIPVAPYGRPVPQAPWLEFRAQTGIPVVFDAAAASDRLAAGPSPHLGEIPVCLSFHATKSLACGEGGAVLTTDKALAEATVRALNFGFGADRNSVCASINGKMSEYHAAVGLAELDGWSEKLTRLGEVANSYRRWAKGSGLEQRLFVTPEISTVYALFHCKDAGETGRVGENLRKARIEHRLWYNVGVHSNDYFSACRRDVLGVTETFAQGLLGLPMSVDLNARDIGRIGEAIERGIGLKAGNAAISQPMDAG